MAQFTSPPTPINRVAALVGPEFLGLSPSEAGAQPSAAAADHVHQVGPTARKVTGFGMAQRLQVNGNASVNVYLFCPPSGLPAGIGQWTIECWADWSTSSVHDGFGFYSQATGYAAPSGLTTGMQQGSDTNPGAIQAYVNGAIVAQGIGIPGSATVQHLAISCDGSTIRFFVNGTQVASAPAIPLPSQYFGAQAWGDSAASGEMTTDEWRVSTVARYAANFTPPTEPFTPDADTWGLWHMDDEPLGAWIAVSGGDVPPQPPAAPIAPWVYISGGQYYIVEGISFSAVSPAPPLNGAVSPEFTNLGWIEGVLSPVGAPPATIAPLAQVSSLQGQVGDLELMNPTGTPAVGSITPGGGSGPTQLVLQIPGSVVSFEFATEITVTGGQAVNTFTPLTNGLFLLSVYLRVTAATTVEVSATHQDVGGAQTTELLASQLLQAGSYALVPIAVEDVAGAAIAINVNAGAANQVYATTAIQAN